MPKRKTNNSKINRLPYGLNNIFINAHVRPKNIYWIFKIPLKRYFFCLKSIKKLSPNKQFIQAKRKI